MPRRVTLVCGPPCAGKSTYVAQHAGHGDLILDQDTIGAAAMRQALAKVATLTAGTAWVIRCAPGPAQRQSLARWLRAEVVLLRPADSELFRRAHERPDPRQHIKAIRTWLADEAAGTPPHRPSAAVQRSSEAWAALGSRRRTLARQVYARDRHTPGYVCPKCRQPIDWALPYRDPHTDTVNIWSKSVDHLQELQDGGALLDVDNLYSAHLTCNSSKGAARRWARTTPPCGEMATIAVDPATL